MNTKKTMNSFKEYDNNNNNNNNNNNKNDNNNDKIEEYKCIKRNRVASFDEINLYFTQSLQKLKKRKVELDSIECKRTHEINRLIEENKDLKDKNDKFILMEKEKLLSKINQ